MTVLIATQNQQVFRDIHKTVKFIPSTKHTCVFNCTQKTFEKIHREVKLLGYNPYALMTW